MTKTPTRVRGVFRVGKVRGEKIPSASFAGSLADVMQLLGKPIDKGNDKHYYLVTGRCTFDVVTTAHANDPPGDVQPDFARLWTVMASERRTSRTAAVALSHLLQREVQQLFRKRASTFEGRWLRCGAQQGPH